MSKINYDEFESEMEFIEKMNHLDEIDVSANPAPVAPAATNPALISKQQALQRQLIGLEKQKAKISLSLAEIEKQIATEKLAQ